MSRCERSPPVDLKIVDALLQFRPVGYGQASEIGDHQTGAMSGDELGAFFVGGEFFITLVARRAGISRGSSVRLRPAASRASNSWTG